MIYVIELHNGYILALFTNQHFTPCTLFYLSAPLLFGPNWELYLLLFSMRLVTMVLSSFYNLGISFVLMCIHKLRLSLVLCATPGARMCSLIHMVDGGYTCASQDAMRMCLPEQFPVYSALLLFWALLHCNTSGPYVGIDDAACQPSITFVPTLCISGITGPQLWLLINNAMIGQKGYKWSTWEEVHYPWWSA